jgi:dihydroneopterin aldolase
VSELDDADVILLEGVQIPAALGVTASERRMRRPVLLDLEIGIDLKSAGETDQIRHTLHYEEVFKVVEEIAGTQEHKLVEALGQRIADAVLEKFAADWVRICVRKPKPIAGVLDTAGIRITRRRS